ncbi:hypothetical protein B0H16DRAFT_1722962 [Mycena metata]|uniref:Uncharacterized protein n=1 Tax=Mycena metata TaxID=1033252 RepID=A0AAD7J2L2_9AGAR|nr:hypothetical protein B0H16DRAFT_1722962 [Mycena metata]
MPRLAKSPSKASAKAVATARMKEPADRSPLVDDEAVESDGDGVLVDPADVNAGSGSEGYDDDFIDDRTPPPEIPLTQRPPSKQTRVFRRAASVIEVDSSEEDLESMAVDDSMYKKPAGVKPSCVCIRFAFCVNAHLLQGFAPIFGDKEVCQLALDASDSPADFVICSKRSTDLARDDGGEPDKKKAKVASTSTPVEAVNDDSRGDSRFDESAMEL